VKTQPRLDLQAIEHQPRHPAPPDNTLAYFDQGSFLWLRASGQSNGAQCTWVYRRAIDFDGLRRTYDNLAYGLLGRRIECSPLPFGRHRWVSWHEPPDIDIGPPVRTRGALTGWIDERAAMPVDPEVGPCWHLGVLPIDDYGTAVSLVASHSVVDGSGFCLAIADAAKGIRHDFGYPPPHSRRRRLALVEDVRQTARNVPEVARALMSMTKLAITELPSVARRRPARSNTLPPLAMPNADDDRPAVVPTATVYVDLADWDARAESLGGTSNSLFAGFAARMAARIGRLRAGDNMVTLAYPINDRAENDLRANALKGIDFAVDPAPVTADLRGIRQDIRQAIISRLGKFEEQEVAFPLIPLVPKALVRNLPLTALGADLPVGCSNLGDMDPAVACVDGTEADYVAMRLVEQNLTNKSHELMRGELYLVSGRICGKLFITIRFYQPDTKNSKHTLCNLVSDTLADFDLTGVLE
jgi:diacylglycerol O-acyltransferase / wax synthase